MGDAHISTVEMSDAPDAGYTPPYPYRWRRKLTTWERLQLAQKNLIGVFEQGAFREDLIRVKILNKHLVICNSPETVQYAFSIKNQHFERKSPVMRHMLRPLIGDGLFISDGETWRKRRRIVSRIVHASRLPEFAPMMTGTAHSLGDIRWQRLPEGATVDVLAEMAQLTAEIICRSIFGRTLKAEQSREVVQGFSAFQKAVSRIDFLSLIGLPDWLPRPRRLAVYRSARRIHRVIDDIIAGYRARPDREDPSLVGSLIDAHDPETGLPLDVRAIRNEALVIFLAGHETTATTLAFAWYLLSQAPDVEARLHAELGTVLGDRLPTLADVPGLVYTRAVIQETLRLYPPIPILAREATDDEIVPKGSIVAVVPWLLHRNPKLWDKPDQFLPERFLDDGGAAPDKWRYVPFSVGPRVCAGMAFGLTEAILCIATLAQRFTLRLADGYRMEPICRVSLRPGDSLPMTLHFRHRTPRPSDIAPPAADTTPTCPFAH
jgi:cytochrome P450